MPALAIDFETYFERGYNLKRLGVLSYVYHPKFRVIGCATCDEQGNTAWYDGDSVLDVLGRYDVLISHNALFDVMVLRRLLGDLWRPTQQLFDTLAAARALLPRGVDLSLDALGRLIVGEGKLGSLEDGVDDLVAYAKRDAWLAMQLYQRLRPLMPEQEVRLIDITTRMSTTPQVVIDHDVLHQELARIQQRRDELCATVGLTEEQLRKRDLVLQRIEQLTGRRPASLDKKHPDITNLKRDCPQVRPLLEAREACSSNLERSRCLKLLELPPRIPMQYKYWGAHTGRWSAGGGIQWQNLSHRSLIRQSITAPPGHRLIIADLSQIELRMNLWFCGEHGLLSRLAEGEDLYCLMATQLFGRPITKNDKRERHLGKIVELACGYGQGWRKFQAVCAAGALGSDPIYLSDAEAQHAIQTYRTTHPHVVGMWRRLQDLIPALAHQDTHVELGPVVFEHERVCLPNGTYLDYSGLRLTDDGWVYGLGENEWRLYSGAILENCLAEGTEVLTQRGWVPIESIKHNDLVFDGENWVTQQGLVHKGKQSVIQYSGVWMTPDHKVLTRNGWKTAYEATSSNAEPYGPAIWPANSPGTWREKAATPILARTLRLRNRKASVHRRSSEKDRHSILRLLSKRKSSSTSTQTRNVRHETVYDLAEYDRPMSSAYTPRLEKLRRARYHCMRTMAEVFRKLLGRYGSFVQRRSDTRPNRQRQGVLSRELPLDRLQNASAKSPRCTTSRHSKTCRRNGHIPQHALLQMESRTAPVYDILNAGPKHRFVVRGGPYQRPIIVHNCIQALSRIPLANAMIKCYDAGWLPAMTTHDELVLVVPETEAERAYERLIAWMTEPLDWAPGLVLGAEGVISERYTKP